MSKIQDLFKDHFIILISFSFIDFFKQFREFTPEN